MNIPRKRVLIDMDSTIVDLMSPWLHQYNLAHDDNLTIEDILTFDLHEHAKGGVAIYDVLKQYGFFALLQPYPGAIAAVEKIAKHHDVYIVSAATEGPCASEKLAWVKKWLPFLSNKQVILAHHKHLVQGDVLIDDGPYNAVSYREAHPDAEIYGIYFPYNKDCNAFTTLFYRYDEPERAWKDISHRLCGENRLIEEGLIPSDLWGRRK